MKIKSTFMAPIPVIAVMLLFAVSRFVDLGAMATGQNICLAVIVLQLLIIVVPTAFYTKLKGEGFISSLRFRLIGVEKLLVTFLAAVTLILGDILLKMVLYNVGLINAPYSVYDYYLKGTEPGVLYALITFALVPAFCEELLFRSLLCAEYEDRGAFTAVIASSLLYGMFSMDFGYFPIYFFAGLMFALVMYLTRSVFASVLCHLCYSVFELGAGETVRTVITKPQSIGFLIFAVAGLFLLCLSVLLGECERIYYGYALKGTHDEYVDKCPGFDIKAFFDALLAPPFLVAALLFVISAIQFGGY